MLYKLPESGLVKVNVKRTKRKTVSLEVNQYSDVIIRAPLNFPEKEVVNIIEKHSSWLIKAIEKQRRRSKMYPEPSDAEIYELKKKSYEILPQKVKYFSDLTGLVPLEIKITGAKKRFGSCSSRNSICFSYLLMQYPEECIDYVVLHELAHIRYHNHSKDFYGLIEKYMPDYKERVKILKSKER